MIVTKDVERAPRTRALIEWMKGIASKFVGSSELSLDDKEFEQVARDLILSVSELHALSRKDDSSANLLNQRLAECGLSANVLRDRHPEVLRDLQRVCGNCTSTRRCANEFKQGASQANRNDYCPNTHTLQALKSENLETSGQISAPIGRHERRAGAGRGARLDVARQRHPGWRAIADDEPNPDRSSV